MQTRYTSADQWADAKDGVIPAPYALEKGEQIIDQYLEPVIFHNVNGPDIGVTTCGVIVKDGLYFKDLDNSGELAPYKDWRLSPEQRAEDMVKHLRLDQQCPPVPRPPTPRASWSWARSISTTTPVKSPCPALCPV